MENLLDEIYSVILLFSFMLGFFLSGALFFRKENSLPNRILGAAVIAIAIVLANFYFYKNGMTGLHNILIVFIQPIDFIFNPLFYFYIAVFTSHIKLLNKKSLIHFTPALFYLIFNMYNFFFLKKVISYNNFFFAFIVSAMYVQAFYYLVVIFKVLKEYNLRIKDYFSEIETLKLSWLKVIIFFFIISWSLSFCLFIFGKAGLFIPEFVISIGPVLGVLFLYFLAYFTLRQPEIFQKVKEMVKQVEDSSEKISTELSESIESKLLSQLTGHMEKDKPYMDNTLTLKQLAGEMAIQPYQLTRVIASTGNHNFYSFINSYRVTEVKALLAEKSNRDKAILDIAFEAGFNSKSTFNYIFKKNVNMAPSEFRKLN